tara:strand:- start:17757 stop:17999 length:243 start_codon:yes stop_codon:yes gene_type:complete
VEIDRRLGIGLETEIDRISLTVPGMVTDPISLIVPVVEIVIISISEIIEVPVKIIFRSIRSTKIMSGLVITLEITGMDDT